MPRAEEAWTNQSVLQLAQGADPVEAILQRAREVVLKALDSGWTGPPFDPMALADLLHIKVVPRYDVADARTVPVGDASLQIEFNPNRPRGRMRYSIAHEIAHSFFPDCAAHVRHRASYHDLVDDEWQLEALCNIGAAELLMPVRAFPRLPGHDLTIDRLVELQRQFEVSMEALLIRTVRLYDEPCAMFCASRIEQGPSSGRYRVDYRILSPAWSDHLERGILLPKTTVLTDCTAVGFTAIGVERWYPNAPAWHVRCVGIPPYPSSLYPRVVGLLQPEHTRSVGIPWLRFVIGDATQPHGEGQKLIAHIVNDATPRWGGRGFAQAVWRKWPEAQADFEAWVRQDRRNLSLGNVHVTHLSPLLAIVHMISQRGYGPSPRPRIRYGALHACLLRLAEIAVDRRATIHMPRIGVGHAGGSWELIEELLVDVLRPRGLQAVIYDLPDHRAATARQAALFTLQVAPLEGESAS